MTGRFPYISPGFLPERPSVLAFARRYGAFCLFHTSDFDIDDHRCWMIFDDGSGYSEFGEDPDVLIARLARHVQREIRPSAATDLPDLSPDDIAWIDSKLGPQAAVELPTYDYEMVDHEMVRSLIESELEAEGTLSEEALVKRLKGFVQPNAIRKVMAAMIDDGRLQGHGGMVGLPTPYRQPWAIPHYR